MNLTTDDTARNKVIHENKIPIATIRTLIIISAYSFILKDICIVEEYENEFGEKGGSILDCKLKTRAFVSTQGDTLNVARRKGTSEFVETGKVAKGYLNPKNSILLKNLIGTYPTDDHYIDFKVEAINDKELRAKYVYAKDEATD